MRGIFSGLVLLTAAVLLPLMSGGCLAAGYAAYVVQGPPKVEAKYTPTTRPMAVVVENSQQKGNAGSMREQLSGLLVAELREQKVAELVESYKVHDLRSSNAKAYRSMKVDEIGKAVNAEQVLYVDLLHADVATNTGGTMMKGYVTAMVRIVDVPTGKVLWPEKAGDGWMVSVETPMLSQTDGGNPEAMREAIARSMADAIAKLFYTYRVEE